MHDINRRDFLKQGALAAGAVGLSGLPLNACRQRPPEAKSVATPTLWQLPQTGNQAMGYVLKYEAIGAKGLHGCLWPTPGWLWDNDNGGGVNSGRWQTLKVRAWMDELGAKEHLVAKDGLGHITL